MSRDQKSLEVQGLRDKFSNSSFVAVTRNFGLSASDVRQLRRSVKKVTASDGESFVIVAKNSLVKIALSNTNFAELSGSLTGPVALVFSKDAVAASKVLNNFAKDNSKLEIVCAVMGEQFLSAAEVSVLASLPSLDELRGKLVGLLQAPATKIAGVLVAPALQLARLLNAYSEK